MTVNGSLSMNDLRAVRFGSAHEFGLEKINETLQADLFQWEHQVHEAIAQFAGNHY